MDGQGRVRAVGVGALRPAFTADDLQALITDNALALKHGTRPERGDYDRCTTFLLDGIHRLDGTHRAGATDRG